MKICDQYDHCNGLKVIQNIEGIFKEIKAIFTHKNLIFGTTSPKEIKTKISDRFNQRGWADDVKVCKSNLTINFMKSKVGVCFQTGNVARTYADILKLCLLHKRG